jgi:hypothetical protein
MPSMRSVRTEMPSCWSVRRRSTCEALANDLLTVLRKR